MQGILDFIKTDSYLLILSVITIILFIGFVMLLISNIKLKDRYKKFMKKIGNGKNIEDDLERFMNKVDRVEEQNKQIISFCQNLDEDIAKCIQKVGIVRYSAFKDTGSDLSFAAALLDEKNNGIVFNGIYSREISNIYAKPVENGNSKYTLSEEETEAIEKAVKSNNLYKAR